MFQTTNQVALWNRDFPWVLALPWLGFSRLNCSHQIHFHRRDICGETVQWRNQSICTHGFSWVVVKLDVTVIAILERSLNFSDLWRKRLLRPCKWNIEAYTGGQLNCKKSKPIESLTPCAMVSPLLSKHSVHMRGQQQYIRIHKVVSSASTRCDNLQPFRISSRSCDVYQPAIPFSFFTKRVANYIEQLCTAHMGLIALYQLVATRCYDDATSIANDELGRSKENKEPRIAQSKLTPAEGLVWPPSPAGKRPGAASNWRLAPKCPAPRGESNRWWKKSPGSSFQLWSPSRFQPAQWRLASGLRTWHLAEFPSQEATLHPACSEDCEASPPTGPRPMPWRARTWDMRSLELLESNLRINHSPCKLPKFP